MLPTKAAIGAVRAAVVARDIAALNSFATGSGLPRNPLEIKQNGWDPLCAVPVLDPYPALCELREKVAKAATENPPGRVVMLGPSGCGKTYAMRCLAAEVPVVMIDFTQRVSSPLEDAPTNGFCASLSAVVSAFTPTDTAQARFISAERAVRCLFLAKALLFFTMLQPQCTWMCELYPAGSFLWFFDAQRTAWGRGFTALWFVKFMASSAKLLESLVNELMSRTDFRLLTAIDEAASAVMHYTQHFVAIRNSTAVSGPAMVEVDVANDSRGALGALLWGLTTLPTVVTCLGTSLNLHTLAVIGSAPGKPAPNVHKVDAFVPLSTEATTRLLNQMLLLPDDTTGAEASTQLVTMLSGKGCYVSHFMTKLFMSKPKTVKDVTSVALASYHSLAGEAVSKLDSAYKASGSL